MAGVVHGGSLGRWFEELCRIKKTRLHEVVVPSETMLSSGKLPSKGGVYVFWWTGPISMLKTWRCSRTLELPGPGGRSVLLKMDDEWLGLSTRLPIPLYVGKNAANISKRIGQHLRLKDKRMLPLGGDGRKHPPPTTSCQLRAGIEHMFRRAGDTRTLILENVGLSYVVLHGNNHAANRFYLEDLAIGLMRPPYNVDVER